MDKLTKKQERIISLIVEGYKNHEICKLVGISKPTLCGHLRKIRDVFKLPDGDYNLNWPTRMAMVNFYVRNYKMKNIKWVEAKQLELYFAQFRNKLQEEGI